MGMVFAVSFILFPKAPASCGKKIWNNVCCNVLLFVWAKKVSLIF